MKIRQNKLNLGSNLLKSVMLSRIHLCTKLLGTFLRFSVIFWAKANIIAKATLNTNVSCHIIGTSGAITRFKIFSVIVNWLNSPAKAKKLPRWIRTVMKTVTATEGKTFIKSFLKRIREWNEQLTLDVVQKDKPKIFQFGILFLVLELLFINQVEGVILL